MIKIDNLNLVYDIGKEVQTYALRNINLTLHGNRMIGVMGPSAAEKFTFIRYGRIKGSYFGKCYL